MDDQSAIRSLREAGMNALTAHEALFTICDRLASADSLPQFLPEDVFLLKNLIISRIYPSNIFGLLVKLDRTVALEVLLRRYVGRGVDPDTKFGGFQYELSIMLTELVETQGEVSLRELVRHADFDDKKCSDPRLLGSIAQALNMRTDEADLWLQRSRIT